MSRGPSFQGTHHCSLSMDPRGSCYACAYSGTSLFTIGPPCTHTRQCQQERFVNSILVNYIIKPSSCLSGIKIFNIQHKCTAWNLTLVNILKSISDVMQYLIDVNVGRAFWIDKNINKLKTKHKCCLTWQWNVILPWSSTDNQLKILY